MSKFKVKDGFVVNADTDEKIGKVEDFDGMITQDGMDKAVEKRLERERKAGESAIAALKKQLAEASETEKAELREQINTLEAKNRQADEEAAKKVARQLSETTARAEAAERKAQESEALLIDTQLHNEILAHAKGFADPTDAILRMKPLAKREAILDKDGKAIAGKFKFTYELLDKDGKPQVLDAAKAAENILAANKHLAAAIGTTGAGGGGASTGKVNEANPLEGIYKT